MPRYYNPNTSFESLSSNNVSMADVKNAEKALSLRFDKQLTDYLLNPIEEEDGAYCEYVGLNRDGYLNTVDATLEYRGESDNRFTAFPNTAVVLASTGNGDCYFYDNAKGRVGLYAHDGKITYPKEVGTLDQFIEYAFKAH